MASLGKVLIIEDDFVARDYLSQFFQEKDCRVVTAENGKTGIEKMEEGPFDIILLDLNMPVMSGLEALPRLRDRDPKTNIVITTAFGSYESKLEAREHGVRDYLVKPVTLAKMQEIAEKYLPKETELGLLTAEGLASVELDLNRLDMRVARLIPENMARMFFLVAVTQNRNILTVAMADPGNHEVVERIRQETGYTLMTLQADHKDILAAINFVYADEADVTEHSPASPVSTTSAHIPSAQPSARPPTSPIVSVPPTASVSPTPPVAPTASVPPAKPVSPASPTEPASPPRPQRHPLFSPQHPQHRQTPQRSTGWPPF